MYTEILELKDYCEKIGVVVREERLFDGYVLRFKNGGDVIQHYGSYGNNAGCVEFGLTGSRLDYCATPLKNAKAFVKRNKEKLNKEVRKWKEPS